MNRQVTLSKNDIDHLNETLDYFLSDDIEENDFRACLRDRGLDDQDFFNEHELLMIEKVPKDLHSHIYYRLNYLRDELLGAIYG